MPAHIDPEICPSCWAPIQLKAFQLWAARRQFRARVILAIGLGLTGMLLVVSFAFIFERLPSYVRELGLFRRERGLAYALAFGLAGVLSLVPAFIAYRWERSLPRLLHVRCPCGAWSGICRVSNTARGLRERAAAIVLSEVAAPNLLEQRRQQLERRHKEARQVEGNREPNPDFDFDGK